MRYPEYQLLDLIFAWFYNFQNDYISINYILTKSGYKDIDVNQVSEVTKIIVKSGFVNKRKQNDSLKEYEFKLSKTGFEMMNNYRSYSGYLQELKHQHLAIIYQDKTPIAKRIKQYILKLIIFIWDGLTKNLLITGIIAAAIGLIIGTLILKHFKII